MPRLARTAFAIAVSAAALLSAACHECPDETAGAAPGSDTTITKPSEAPVPPGPKAVAPAPIFDSWKLHPDDKFVDVTKEPLTKPLVMPCDFPGRGGLELYNCLDINDASTINTALDLAAYNVWRVLQVLDKVEEAQTFEARDKLWRTYFNGNYEAYQTNGHTSLQSWFGSYSASRFNKIHYAYKKVWAMYLGPGWKSKRISCSCRAQAMSAHAANPYGIEVCPKFFQQDLFDQARLFVHEFMHDVKDEPGGNIQDTHSECTNDDGDDGLQKCYSAAESYMLAEKYPDIANSNPQNYAIYSRRLMESYRVEKCTNPAVCSPRDVGAKGCQPVVPKAPQYPECTGGPGDVGCACADVDIVKAEDAADDGGYPDGEGSFLANKSPGGQFCHEPGTVCGKQMFQGKEIPICKSCKTQPGIGCPCTDENECGGGALTCWGGYDSGFDSIGRGTCLPTDAVALQKLPWFCLDNCAAISSYGLNGAACVFKQVSGLEFTHGTCVNFATSCGKNLPGQCEQSGMICRVDAANNDVCVAECKTKADCAAHGFPDSYECDAEGDLGFQNGHCVAAGCGSSTSAYCKLFR